MLEIFFRKNKVNVDFNKLLESPLECEKHKMVLTALFEQHENKIEFKCNEPYDVKLPDSNRIVSVYLSHDLVRRISSKTGEIVYQSLGESLGKGKFGEVSLSLFTVKNCNGFYEPKKSGKCYVVKRGEYDLSDESFGRIISEIEATGYMYGAKPLVLSKNGDIVKYYIVTSRHNGNNLSEYFFDTSDEIQFREVCDLMLQTLQQIKKLHKRYTHNDISLDNIMCDPVTGEVALIDFGLSEKIVYVDSFFSREESEKLAYSPLLVPDIVSLGKVMLQIMLPYDERIKFDGCCVEEYISKICVPDEHKEKIQKLLSDMMMLNEEVEFPPSVDVIIDFFEKLSCQKLQTFRSAICS